MPRLVDRIRQRVHDARDEYHERYEDIDSGRRNLFGQKTEQWYNEQEKRRRQRHKHHHHHQSLRDNFDDEHIVFPPHRTAGKRSYAPPPLHAGNRHGGYGRDRSPGYRIPMRPGFLPPFTTYPGGRPAQTRGSFRGNGGRGYGRRSPSPVFIGSHGRRSPSPVFIPNRGRRSGRYSGRRGRRGWTSPSPTFSETFRQRSPSPDSFCDSAESFESFGPDESRPPSPQVAGGYHGQGSYSVPPSHSHFGGYGGKRYGPPPMGGFRGPRGNSRPLPPRGGFRGPRGNPRPPPPMGGFGGYGGHHGVPPMGGFHAYGGGHSGMPGYGGIPGYGGGPGRMPPMNPPPMTEQLPNHYATLGVSHNATKEEIQKAGKKMRILTHPDKLKKPDMTEADMAEIDAKAASVGQAVDLLTNDKERRIYDMEMGF